MPQSPSPSPPDTPRGGVNDGRPRIATVQVIFNPDNRRLRKRDEFYMYLSKNVYLIAKHRKRHDTAMRPPTETSHFRQYSVRIDLSRVEEKAAQKKLSKSDPPHASCIAALRDITSDKVHVYDRQGSFGVLLSGHITTSRYYQHFKPIKGSGNRAIDSNLVLIAESQEERDRWLDFFRLRFAPLSLLHGAFVDAFTSATSRAGASEADAAREAVFAAASDATFGFSVSALPTLLEETNLVSMLKPVTGDAVNAAVSQTGGVPSLLRRGFSAGNSIWHLFTASAEDWDPEVEGIWARLAEHARCTLNALENIVNAKITDRRTIEKVVERFVMCWQAFLRVEEIMMSKLSAQVALRKRIEELQRTEKALRDRMEFVISIAQGAKNKQDLEQIKVEASARVQDGEYKGGLYCQIALSDAAGAEGSFLYMQVVEELLDIGDTEKQQPVAVKSVKGQGGAGKTTTCLLALHDPRVQEKYADGVFAFEVGGNPVEKDLIEKISGLVEECRGLATAAKIAEMTDLEKAVRKAQIFFRHRRILLVLDNVWPGNYVLERLKRIASAPGSCVLFTTRSVTLAADYNSGVVALETLDLDQREERKAAECIFYAHLRPRKDEPWCDKANVEEALRLSQGLPLAIAQIAALVRHKLILGETTDLLRDVKKELAATLEGDSYGLERGGLFPAMKESLDFLDCRHNGNAAADTSHTGVMTRRFAALHTLDRSENRVTKYVLSYLWDVPTESAGTTAGKMFELGLVSYAVPVTQTHADGDFREVLPTLTLHDLQADYSAHLADSCAEGVTVEKVHSTAVCGIFEGSVDVDELTANDFVSRCEELCQMEKAGDDRGGRYVVSNLVRHLIGSLTVRNASRRWDTIQGLLSDARWLLLWQRVDGWAFVCNRYAKLSDALAAKKGVTALIPEAEIEAIAELGRAGRIIRGASRSWRGEDEEKKAAVQIYYRLYATWWDGVGGLSRRILQRALSSLCAVAGRWWMRPTVGCHYPLIRDRRLRTAFAASSTPVGGCVLIGDNSHVVTGAYDGVVRVQNGAGVVVAQHRAHSDKVNGVCVGRMRSDTGYCVFSVSHDGKLMRWNVSLLADAADQVHTATPVVVDTTEKKLVAVSCSEDASVVAAGDATGIVYVWALGRDDELREGVTRVEGREHTDLVLCVAVSADGATVLSGSYDGTCREWDVTGAFRRGATFSSRAVLADSTGKEDRHSEKDIASVGESSNAEVWVFACAFAHDDRVAVTGNDSGEVRFWNLANATMLGKVDLQSGCVSSLAAAGREGNQVVAGTSQGTAHVVRVSDCAVTAVLGRDDLDWVRAVGWSKEDNSIVACAHNSGQVKIWHADRPALHGAAGMGMVARGHRPSHSDHVSTISASDCGRFVVSGGDSTVRCWCADTGRQLWMHSCASGVNCVCVSANAAHVACACDDGTVCVLDMADGEIVFSWTHYQSTLSVCLHELSDDFVWSGHANGEVVAWRRDESAPAYRIQGLHEEKVVSLGVAARGRSVYSQDKDGRIVLTEIVDARETSTEIAREAPRPTDEEGNGDAFAEHTSQGFRTGTKERQLSRVRRTYAEGAYVLTAATAELSSILNVKLRMPNCPERASLTGAFDSDIWAIDASIVAAADRSHSFAQVVCGLFNGSVCILRQPLTEDTQLWHPAESSH